MGIPGVRRNWQFFGGLQMLGTQLASLFRVERAKGGLFLTTGALHEP